MNAEKFRSKTCCFTGHREIPEADEAALVIWLEEVISQLYLCYGVRYFGSGGAKGFDILAAEVTRTIANSRGWEIIRYTDVSQDIPQSGRFYSIAVDFCMQGDNGIVSAPIRKDISDERLQEMYGKDYIGAVVVMIYDK